MPLGRSLEVALLLVLLEWHLALVAHGQEGDELLGLGQGAVVADEQSFDAEHARLNDPDRAVSGGDDIADPRPRLSRDGRPEPAARDGVLSIEDPDPVSQALAPGGE